MDVGEIIPDRHGLDNTPILKRRDSHSIIITSFRKLGIDKPANLVYYYVTRYIVERNSLEVALVNNALSDLGRFSEPALLILVSLADGDKHGYAMIEDIESLNGTRLGPGTLYGALARLERRGLIEPLASDDRRKPYRMTGLGA